MRLLDYLTGLISLIGLPLICWWGIHDSPQNFNALEARLKAEAEEALVAAGEGWASVRMDGQTAVLMGAAPSDDSAVDAARAVLRSSGAGGLLFGGITQVRNEATRAPAIRPYIWAAEKMAGGGIALTGHVPTKAVRDTLYLEASAISTGAVSDRVMVAAGVPEGNWLGVARLGLSKLAELDTGVVQLADHHLSLRGTSEDAPLRIRLATELGAVSAPFHGVSLVLSRAPYWRAEHNGDSIVLSGSVPSDSDRRGLVAAAGRAGSIEVIDQMQTVPDTAASWTGGARAGLAHFAAFSHGTLAYDPALNGFIIDGKAPASTLQFLSEDISAAGAGLQVFVAAATRVTEATAPASGDLKDCATRLNSVLSGGAVRFEPGGARFMREDAAGLDAMAMLAGQCGSEDRLELAAAPGDALGPARAAALADFLQRAGLPRPSLSAIAYGPEATGGVMDGSAAPVPEPPIKFMLRQRSER